MLADELNAAGLDMRKTLREDINIPWTKETVKEYLFKAIAKGMYDKGSTTELTKTEIGEVYDVLMRHMGEKFGIYVEWPHWEEENDNQHDTTCN